MRTILKGAGLLLLALTMIGCGPLNFLVVKTVALFSPPPKTQPLYSLEGKSIVVLVDAANQDLADSHPQMTYKVARAVAGELSDRRAAASIVSPRDVVTYAQSEPDFRRKSAVAIGTNFNVDLVVHVIVQTYHLAGAAASDTYSGMAGVGLRVIDVQGRRQAFPDMERLHLVEVRSGTGITAGSLAGAEKTLLDALALKVAQVFTAYELDELPKKAEVK